MKTTAYLLGAGASCKSLPVVSEIRGKRSNRNDEDLKSIEYVVKHLDSLSNTSPDSISFIPNIKRIKDDLKFLSQHLDEFPDLTIDGMMRKMYFGSTEVYFKLKKCMNLYFNIIEFLNGLDARYDILFTNLLSNHGEFPKNIIFLNWNYDRQIRLAINELKKVNVKPSFHFQQANSYESESYITEVKLNGIFYPTIENSITPIKRINGGDIKKYLLSNLVNPVGNFGKLTHVVEEFQSILFAWESRGINPRLSEDLKDIQVLVVIGYSFPHFNRAIDEQLLKAMSGSSKSLKIIVQDKRPEYITDILNNISATQGLTFSISLVDPDLFHIPQNITYS